MLLDTRYQPTSAHMLLLFCMSYEFFFQVQLKYAARVLRTHSISMCGVVSEKLPKSPMRLVRLK